VTSKTILLTEKFHELFESVVLSFMVLNVNRLISREKIEDELIGKIICNRIIMRF
jgi:hypothetical protein